MRRLFLLLTLALVVLVAVYRDRLYLRDPLGKVARNDVAQDDTRVFINYENDVLVREKHGREMFVVQHWSHQQAYPGGLTCIEGMLCVAPADRVVDVSTPAGREPAQMSNREVSFVDDAGQHVVVTIR